MGSNENELPRDGKPMRFGRLLFWSLLGPVIVLFFPYVFALSVMHANSGSSLDERGAGVLIATALVAALVELVAVPVAIVSLLRHPEYRTIGNVVVTVAGFIPASLFTLFAVSILFGHG